MDKRWETHAGVELVSAARTAALKGDVPTQIQTPGNREDLEALKKAGSSIWLDTGDRMAAARLWARQMTGLTTNNTLANQVVQTGVMDNVITQAAERIRKAIPDISEEELVIEVGFIVNAKIARNLAASFQAKVSVELHPALAYDTEATVMFAKRYHEINPDDFYIKVPLTPEGLLAVRKIEKDNIRVNLTLGFSARQNYLAARLADPAFVNVFLGRLNQVVKENEMGDGKNVGEKVTLASQKRVADARKKDKVKTLQIAASMRSGDQVLALAGVDVHTIPPKAMEEFFDLKLAPSKIKSKKNAKPVVKVKSGKTTSSLGLDLLWDVDNNFKKMVDKLLKEDLDKMIGPKLVEFARDNGAPDLFGDYSEADRRKIRDTGKIPRIADWKGRNLALDDLMTVSALESFSKDQDALDDRIRKMIREKA